MKNCPFCKLDTSLYYNQILEETNCFYIIPSLGSLVEGYVLILPKQHIYSMSKSNKKILEEYNGIIEKYRKIFKKIYGKYPIVFEHGTPNPSGISANSVIHGHAHIVNHNYKKESEMIKKLNFKKINSIYDIQSNKNYIYYKNQAGINYVTYEFEPISQIMQIYIANDLEINENYNWRNFAFENNILKTIKKIKENNK